MPEPGRGDAEAEIVVVGGGLAGLACAHGLARAGQRVRLLEGADEVGGRARTVWHRGRPVDRGFQAVFPSYRETRALMSEVGIPRRDLRRFTTGAVFHDGRRTHRLAPGPLGLLRFSALSASDRAALALLGAEVATQRASTLLAGGHEALSTLEYLRARGFTEDAIEGFFRPLFGAILLDRELGADADYFRFLLAMMVRGGAALPSDGVGMIADWTAVAARARGVEIETGAPVASIEPGSERAAVAGVRLVDGRMVPARAVVLAVGAPAARTLLGPLDPASAERVPTHAGSSATAAFALDRPLYRGRAIVLNAAPDDRDGPRVDLLCQTTNITRPGVVEGPHIVLALSVRTGAGGSDGLAEAVERLVRRWSPSFPWGEAAELIAVYEHPFAQFRPLPGVRLALPGPRTAVRNLVLAGDLTTHPSIEGAVASGRQAARILMAA